MFVARLDDASGDSFKTDEEAQDSPSQDESISSRLTPEFEARVYPNPTTGKVFIQFKGIADKSVITVDVYDVAGAHVLSLQASDIRNNTAEMDMGQLANGVYLLKINAGANRVFHKITLAR